jgi:hypothetical protein
MGYWEREDIDYYAKLEKDLSGNVYYMSGTWWRKITPFFYRQLFPFHPIEELGNNYSKINIFKGYQYVVKYGEEWNSYLNLLISDNLKQYSLESLPSKQKNQLRKAIKNGLSCREIEKIDEFIDQGYLIYNEFIKRTSYRYRDDRKKKENFIKWAATIFKYHKIKRLGVFLGNKMVAISLSYLIEDIVFFPTYFSNDIGLKLKAADLMYHEIREKAKYSESVNKIFWGFLGKKSIDEFKLLRGIKIQCIPAKIKINPIILILLKQLSIKKYRKLVGQSEKEINQLFGHLSLRIKNQN